MTEEQKNVEHLEDVQTTKTVKKFNLKTWHLFVLGIVGILLVAFFIFYMSVVQATKHVSQKPFILKVAKVLELPAAKVNGEKVLYTDYIEDLNTLNKFYGQKPAGFPDATPEQISDQVLTRLIANELVKETAKKYQVTINNADVETFKNELLKQFTDEKQAESELMQKYGWTLAVYVEKVVKPIVLEQKLQSVFASSTSPEGANFATPEVQVSHILFPVSGTQSEAVVKVKAQKVLDEIKAGADFATEAIKYGSDSTTSTGGDLGWLSKGQTVPEFELAAFSAPVGKVYDQLVRTQYGWHIIKVTGQRDSRDFVAFMDNMLKTAKVQILIDVHNPFVALLNPPAANSTSTTK